MDTISIKELGGPAKIARICGVSSQAVSQWKRIPRDHAKAIAEATGVPLQRLLPDVFGQEPARRTRKRGS